MKTSFFLTVLAASSLCAAENSSTADTPNLNTIFAVVSPLYKQVQNEVLAAYNIDPIKFYEMNDSKPFGAKTTKNEQTLREHLDNAFEKAWTQHEPHDAQLQKLKQDIKTVMINYFIETEYYGLLTTCGCISAAKRISFAVLATQQILEKFKHPNQKIRATFFASGLLLQEFLLLRLLVDHGYSNITVNFVDFGYPDPVVFRRVLNQLNPEEKSLALKHYKQKLLRASGITEEQDDLSSINEESAQASSSQSVPMEEADTYPLEEKETLKEKQEQWIKQNKELFPEFAELFGDDYFGSPLTYQKAFDRVKNAFPAVTFNTYKNMYDYIHFVQKYPNHKADIFSIIDPDLTTFDVAPFPSQANLLGLKLKNKPDKNQVDDELFGDKPDIFITLAKDQPVQVSVLKETYEKDDHLREVVDAIRNKILETDSDRKLSYVFRDWLIKKFSATSNIQHIKELLDKNKKLLQQPITYKDLLLKHAKALPIGMALHKNEALLSQGSNLLTHYALQQIFNEVAVAQDELKNIQKNNSTEPLPLLDEHNATVEEVLSLIEELEKRIQNSTMDTFDFVWYSDPHLAFQELIRETAKNDALIYLYYKYNTSSGRVNVRFEEVLKPEYINQDVFGPIVGMSLLYSWYARIDLANGNLIIWDDIKNSLPKEAQSIEQLIENDSWSINIHVDDNGEKSLFLSGEDLVSLKGLRDIPGIEDVQTLYLNNNQLTHIPSGTFKNLKKLEKIYLDDNPLEEIATDAFEGAEFLLDVQVSSPDQQKYIQTLLPQKSIALLALHNRLPEVMDHDEHKSLHLSYQDLVSLEGLQDIPGIEDVQSLYLNNNLLTTIDPSIFNNLHALEWLYLSGNYLSEQQIEAIKRVLKWRNTTVIADEQQAQTE